MVQSKIHSTKQLIGQLIKRQRLKNNLTQQQLADMLKSDRQYVWRIENGKINLTLDYLNKIITKLKCTYKEFFEIND